MVIPLSVIQGTLALLEDCGPVVWSLRWKDWNCGSFWVEVETSAKFEDLVLRWMEQHQENLVLNEAILLVLMEAACWFEWCLDDLDGLKGTSTKEAPPASEGHDFLHFFLPNMEVP